MAPEPNPTVARNLGVVLTEPQLGHWTDHGWLALPAALGAARVTDLATWVDEVERWASTDGPGLHHFEQTVNAVDKACNTMEGA